MVEVNAAVQHRRYVEEHEGMDAVNGLWAHNLERMSKAGISADEIANSLNEIRIEPVLTAHPTEAKRSTILEHHRSLYLLLVKRENSMYNAIEQDDVRSDICLLYTSDAADD